MSEFVTLKAADGQQLGAYVAHPAGEPVAGLVVVQEIFGVNHHIRTVADGYAKDGFLVVAPALFDRIEPGVELGYTGADRQKAMSLLAQLDTEKSLLDVAAAIECAASVTGKRTGVVGYCYGGTMAWLAASRLNPGAAVVYYGGRIAQYADEELRAPVLLHFGRQDAHIPEAEIDRIHTAHPEVEIYLYDAGHGFNRDADASYNPVAALAAWERSLQFLKLHLV